MKTAIAALAAVALLAPSVSAETFSPDQKAEIDARVRAYILENPEIIVEAMEVLERRRQAEQAAQDADLVASVADELYSDGFSHVAGNPDGDVTVVEFADYRCGYCKQAHDGVRALLEADPGVRLITKEFPILGPESTYAARAALASMRQGDDRYWDFNDALMRHRGPMNEGNVMRLAADAGLDADRLAEDMRDPDIARNIQQTYALARQLQINGTPAFVIGGQVVRGYVPFDTLREMVETARESG